MPAYLSSCNKETSPPTYGVFRKEKKVVRTFYFSGHEPFLPTYLINKIGKLRVLYSHFLHLKTLKNHAMTTF